MRKDYSQQLSAQLLTLRNINDHLKNMEDSLKAIMKKLDEKQFPENTTFKHLVVLKNNKYNKEKK
jgi:hypothetical protein